MEDWGNLMACKHPPFYTCGTGSGEGARWPEHLSASKAEQGWGRHQGDNSAKMPPQNPSEDHATRHPVQGASSLAVPSKVLRPGPVWEVLEFLWPIFVWEQQGIATTPR